jgi:hypothetical protein
MHRKGLGGSLVITLTAHKASCVMMAHKELATWAIQVA